MSGFFRKRPGAHIVLQTTPTLYLAVVVTTCYNVFVQRTGSEKEPQYVFVRPEVSKRPLPHFLEDVIGYLIKIAAGEFLNSLTPQEQPQPNSCFADTHSNTC